MRRDDWEIKYDILNSISHNKNKKTQIITSVAINWGIFNMHIQELLKKGLVVHNESDNIYKITDKGCQLRDVIKGLNQT
jgi:predicted transcriptional regulator